MKIGLLIIATNEYIKFLQTLITSADKYFCKNNEVEYFIFSDRNSEVNTLRKINFIEIKHQQWPWITLNRYKTFYDNSNSLLNMDYLYYCDVDMIMVDEIDESIISERVATQHPGFYGQRGTPENNPLSLAYVSLEEKMQYFAGGFNGGSSKEFLKMSKILSRNIEEDYKKNIIAVWHDESHMNRYFIDNPPTKILSPSYCFGEGMDIPFTPKIISIDKDNTQYHV